MQQKFLDAGEHRAGLPALLAVISGVAGIFHDHEGCACVEHAFSS
jgi:hypothetical protein